MNELKLTLINGVFTVEESQKIILDVVASKIQFHEKKKLSALIKNQTLDAYSDERINNLKQSMDQIKSQLSNLSLGSEVTIQCDIHIKITHPEA
ncbi:MAG: hypothetical protein EB023_08140 [Flavobacteriia bacterium]|nr:hypothetical protein [Flavobacteriia bacterium]